jgi:type I restriction enzyme S subunit
MSTTWPKVRLGDLLRKSEETIAPERTKEYREITVRLWGKGVIERGRIAGASLAGRRFVAREGQFIASRIDARNGAMGLVPASLDGALVTNDFPLFSIEKQRLLPGFLSWLCRTSDFVELCLRASEGTTNRVRLKEERFLALELRLPPLADQQRIVARIEALATRVAEAQSLRQQASQESVALVSNQVGAVLSRLAARHPLRTLGSFSPHVTSGPRSWAKHYEDTGFRFYRAQDVGPVGTILDDSKVFITPPSGGQGRSARLHHGDLMIVITGATVGRVSLFREGLEPGFVSQHVGICRLPQSEVEPEFVLWGLRAPSGQAQLLGQRYGQGKPGLNLSNIRSLSMPFPPLAEQRRTVAELDAFQSKAYALTHLQAQTAMELDALMPAILDRAFKGEL